MPDIKILVERELRDAVQLDNGIVDCIESAFKTLAGGDVVMPPILSMAIHDSNGEVDVKTAYVPGVDSFAVKISPGFFDNPKLGLPSTGGMMNLFSSSTGILQAVLLDNGYLTDVRTAAAGAVAAKHLSREDASSAAVFGAGAQAKLQLEALTLVRPINRAVIWARDEDKAAAAARELSESLGIAVSPATSSESAVRAADIVVTTTPTLEPLIESDWLHPGLHVTAMGSDQSEKNELEPECLLKANAYVPDRLSQCAGLGELHHAIEKGLFPQDASMPELGDVIATGQGGRTSSDDITIADLTGTGLQDTAIATLARQRCDERGVGSVITS